MNPKCDFNASFCPLVLLCAAALGLLTSCCFDASELITGDGLASGCGHDVALMLLSIDSSSELSLTALSVCYSGP